MVDVIYDEDLTDAERHWMDPKENKKGEPYISVRVAASKTKRDKTTISRAIRAGELVSVKDGKRWFVSAKSLVQWLGIDVAKSYGLVK